MKPTIRHQHEPPALGCRWCGVDERGHARRWVPSHRWHEWAEPTRAQVDARIRARLNRAAAERAARLAR